MPPPARYMHTIDYVPRLSLCTIYGGRDDSIKESPIFDDLWIIKLFNLEYIKVQVGGKTLPTGRCNHCSFVNSTELIICGGMGNEYKLKKDIEIIELDQDKVDKTNPYLGTY